MTEVNASSSPAETVLPQHLQEFWKLTKELDAAVRINNAEEQAKVNERLTFLLGSLSPAERAQILSAIEQEGVSAKIAYTRSSARKNILKVIYGAGQIMSDAADMVPPLLAKTWELIWTTIMKIKKAHQEASAAA